MDADKLRAGGKPAAGKAVAGGALQAHVLGPGQFDVHGQFSQVVRQYVVACAARQVFQLSTSRHATKARAATISERASAKRAAAGKGMPYTVIPRPTEGEMIQTIERLANEHSIVIIDLEGAASRMTSRALARSHLVLVPFNQSPVDAELVATAVALIDEEGEALGRRIPFRLVRSRDSAAIATKTSKRIASAIEEAGLPSLPVGLVERAAYRDIYEFGALLSELDPGSTSGLAKAQENAQQLTMAVIGALKEEYPT